MASDTADSPKTASPIKTKISDLMKASLKSGDKDTLGYCRNIHAVIRKKEIDDRIDLDDAAVLKLMQSSIKQRQDSIDQFRAGNRPDLVEKEEKELKFLQGFLPAQMSDEELKAIVVGAVKQANAQSAKDIGAVMKLVMPQVQGKADGKRVNQAVSEALAQKA